MLEIPLIQIQWDIFKKWTIIGPEFILPYGYVPCCEHQKDVTGGGERHLIWTELEAIFGEIKKIL